MKRALYILSAALMVFASSCSKDEQPVNNYDVKMVQATINAESSNTGDGTKTIATYDTDTQKYKITWEEGDELSVFNSSTSTPMTKFTAISAGEKTKFNGEIPAGSTINYAILPYDAEAKASGKVITTSIPAEQSGDFSNVVLAGWPKDTKAETGTEYNFNYQFEAVCGIVKFSFDHKNIAEGKTITSITLTADKPISGEAKITYGGEKPVMEAGQWWKLYNEITIVKDKGFENGDYYFATFPISAADSETGMKISLRFETSDGNVAYKNAELKSMGTSGNKHIFAANIVKNIGTVKVTSFIPSFTSGEFTVNASGKKVTFSRGNLQYQASGNNGNGLWRFAINQWDIQGEVGNLTRPTGMANNGPRATQSDWIDLFPLGHTGWTDGNGKTYYPYNACPQSDTYLKLNKGATQIAGTDADWGRYCNILNGDEVDPKGTWRLISLEEFNYLAYSRTTCSSMHYVDPANPNNHFDVTFSFLKCGIKTGIIGDKGKEIVRYGVMLFPDHFVWPTGFVLPNVTWHACHINKSTVFNENAPSPHIPAVQYSLTELAIFEAAGVVFLPSAGKWQVNQNNYEVKFEFLDGSTEYSTLNTEGYYWTSSSASMIASYRGNVLQTAGLGEGSNQEGCSVRLVKDVPVE